LQSVPRSIWRELLEAIVRFQGQNAPRRPKFHRGEADGAPPTSLSAAKR
jgi:hypothetical protein